MAMWRTVQLTGFVTAVLLNVVSAHGECVALRVGTPPLKKIVLHGVEFDSNGALLPAAVAVVDEAAQLLASNDGLLIIVDQHANPENQNFRCTLDRQQAKAVRRYLVEQGVAANRIALQAFGQPGPLARHPELDDQPGETRVALHTH
jgi:OmpA-OmpF porin, OOP family